MQVVKIDQIKEKEIILAIKEGKIFIYPTDTVYGIGCNGLNKMAVEKIRAIKQTDHPFSVIVPSKSWIQKHLYIQFNQFLKLLPGPYTLIFFKKRPNWLPWLSGKKLAVRIPNHPIARIVAKTGLPFVSTSANISGQPAAKNVKELKIAEKVDIIIDGGQLPGKPSTIFDLTGKKPKRIR
jgi:tRNA threonylcarbamoyl adenosine modification protein (Sua5/YciO/YrdC/YwlC family)